jgi:O-antigen ligase
MSATSGEALPGVRRWETRGEVARHGTWRALLWSVFIAVVFFELTHPRRLIPDFPVANLVLAGLTAGVLLLDHRNVRLPRIPWTIVVYLALCAASVLWSIGRSDTVRMTLLYAWIALLACICVTQTDTQTLLRGISWGGVLVVAVTLISVLVDPKKYGGGLLFPGAGPGVHGTKGVIGYSVVLALTAALMRRPLNRRSWVELGLTVVITAAGNVIASATTGRIGAVCVVVAWAILLVLSRLRGRSLARTWVAIGALAAVAVVAAILNRDRITKALGETSDFNGRFEIWRAVIGGWLEAPVAGHGFGAVWKYAWWRLDGSPALDRMNKAADIVFFHGHNVLLDILPQLGALGLVAALLVLGVLAVRGVRGTSTSTAAAGWALLVLVAVLVMGLAEPMLSVPVGWFTVVAATAAARRGGDG